MPWPLSQDYNEAIQSPGNFADADLRSGVVATSALGLPTPFSGNFADVYEVRGPSGRWAVKCFTREVSGLRERYTEISRHLRQAKLPFTVDFSYLEQGIRVAGRWYPVLKMQWVEGLTFNQFVAQNVGKSAKLDALLQIWARMARNLRATSVGHCDLQHGNVLLVPDASGTSLAIKLIDYDGMYVPALAGTKSGEVGHPSYQHPQRLREGTYSIEVDRFPLLLIATALRALSVNGRPLWEKYDNGDNLLFKEEDLRQPGHSELFQELALIGDPTTVTLCAAVRKTLAGRLESAPLLEEILPDGLPATKPARAPRSTASVAEKPASPPVPDDFSDLGASAHAASGRQPAPVPSGKGGISLGVFIGGAAALFIMVLAGAAGAAYLATRLGFGQVAVATMPPAPPTYPPTRPVSTGPGQDHETSDGDGGRNTDKTDLIQPKKDQPRDRPPADKPPADGKPADPIRTKPPSPVPAVPARLTRVLEFDGFDIVGPFDNGSNDAGLDQVFPPETEKEPDFEAIYQGKTGKVGWCTVQPDATGYFDLHLFFAPNTDNIVSYLTRAIDSPMDQEATVLLGADDACKLWVNEKLIHTNRDHVRAVPAREAVAIKLKKGRNRILFKINNGLGLHGFYMTILSEQELTALPVVRPPVPNDALLEFAEKKARRDHQVEYAKRKPEEIQAFAKLLLHDGLDKDNKPADRFVFLREARDLAGILNDLPLSLRAAEEMARDFAVNAREMKAAALERAGGAATNLVGHSNVVAFALAVAEEAEEDDDYEMAERLVKTAQTSAGKTGLPAFTGTTQGRLKAIAALRKAYEPVKDALQALSTKTDDADANLVVGKFYALAKGDWDRGLLPLKQGSDAKMKALAESDLAVPPDAEAAEDLGDRYAAQANAESEPAKTQLLYRACYWYAQADAQYRGLERTNKVRKKRLEIEKTLPAARLVVLFAWYGAYDSWMDVTTNVRCVSVQPGGFKTVAKAEAVALGADPAPGQHKSLVVLYRYRGALRLSMTGQAEAPIIPLPAVAAESAPGRPAPGQKLAILFARYGNEGTYADIAAKAQGAVKGSSLHIGSPDELGISDPYPGRMKAFAMVYRLGGKVRVSVTPDNIPVHLGTIADSP